MQNLDWVLIAVYSALVVGLVVAVRRARSLEDYAVASREIPGSILFATLAATFVGPGYSIGLVGKASEQGFVWLAIFAAFALQMFIVGRYVSPRLRTYVTARTIPEIIGMIYGPATRAIATVITLALLIGLVGVISRAAAELVSGLTPLSLTSAAILASTVTIAYTSIGGLKADILLDILHFILLAIAVPVLFMSTLARGLQENALPDIIAGATESIEGMSSMAIMGAMLAFFFGEAMIPPYVARSLAAQTPKAARRSFQLTAVFGCSWFLVCTSLGVLIAGTEPDGIGDGALLHVMQTQLPAGLLGLMTVALLGIILSSWDSLLNCASVSFTVDLLPILTRKQLAPMRTMIVTQALAVVVGVSALIFALHVPGIVEALMYCYTLWAPTIVLPLCIGVVKPSISPYSGMSAILAGGIAAASWEWSLGSPLGIPSLVPGLLANQVAFWLTHVLITHKPSAGPFAPEAKRTSCSI